MRLYAFLLVLLSATFLPSTCAAELSDTQSVTLNQKQIRDLTVVAKVWGLAKYYHPAVAGGQVEMDRALFELMQPILANSTTDRDQSILKWLEQLGDIPTDRTRNTNIPKDAKLVPDITWIDDKASISSKLAEYLHKVYQSPAAKEHHYVYLRQGVRNPEFQHELAYKKHINPDLGLRLLALFRFWNMVEYFFPYKYLIEGDWDEALARQIPMFAKADGAQGYVLAVIGLLDEIGDTHAGIWRNNPVMNDYFGVRRAPLRVRFVEGKPVITGFYDEEYAPMTGLKVGDIITHLDGKPVEHFIEKLKKETTASNDRVRLRNVARLLLRGNGEKVNITVSRGLQSITKSIFRLSRQELELRRDADFNGLSEVVKRLGKDIGYLNLGKLKRSQVAVAMAGFKDARGLILDLRNYPADFTVFELGRYLYPHKQPFVSITRGSTELPGLFTFGKTLEVGIQNPDYYKGHIVILVDEQTQSSSEYHAMAFRRAPKAIVMGSTTAGADGNVSPITLPGGINTAFTGIGIYYPDGGPTQQIGIVPEVVAEPTIAGITEGRDEVLDKAVWMLSTGQTERYKQRFLGLNRPTRP